MDKKFCFKNNCSTGKKCFTTHKKNKLNPHPKKGFVLFFHLKQKNSNQLNIYSCYLSDKRKIYCKKVKCIALSAGPVCNCPMHIDYVCDAEGNKYDNVCAAACAGLEPAMLDKCSFW